MYNEMGTMIAKGRGVLMEKSPIFTGNIIVFWTVKKAKKRITAVIKIKVFIAYFSRCL